MRFIAAAISKAIAAMFKKQAGDGSRISFRSVARRNQRPGGGKEGIMADENINFAMRADTAPGAYSHIPPMKPFSQPQAVM